MENKILLFFNRVVIKHIHVMKYLPENTGFDLLLCLLLFHRKSDTEIIFYDSLKI